VRILNPRTAVANHKNVLRREHPGRSIHSACHQYIHSAMSLAPTIEPEFGDVRLGPGTRNVQDYLPEEREVGSCRRHSGREWLLATAAEVDFGDVFPSLSPL